MSRLVTALAVALMMAFAPVAAAQVKAGGMFTSEVDTVLTLISVDPVSHTALLGNRDGTSLVLEIPPQARKMQHAKPGALFRMHFVESIGLQIEQDGTAGTFEQETVELAPAGAPTGIEVVRTKRVSWSVQSIDPDRRRITLRDAHSNVSTFTYTAFLENADEIAAGDTFNVIHSETLTLEMMPNQIQTSR
jgi:hypothetical protein